MARTDRFKGQHRELVRIVAEISSLAEASQAEEKAKDISAQLHLLAGKLNVHLAMDDNALYPSLIGQKDERLAPLARKYVDEMGHIKEAFANFVAKWPTPKAIENDPVGFKKEIKGLFAALTLRIQKEETEPYPMVDELERNL